MEFRLIYEGPLHGQGAKSSHKWEIRRALHPQLQRLWRERPLKDVAHTLLAHPAQPGKPSVIVEKGGLRFAPLVTQRLDLYAELSVLLFRQQPRGTLITDGGDIDNRLKTLLDGGPPRDPRGARSAPLFLPAGRRLAGHQGVRRVRATAAPCQTRRGGGHHFGACEKNGSLTRQHDALTPPLVIRFCMGRHNRLRFPRRMPLAWLRPAAPVQGPPAAPMEPPARSAQHCKKGAKAR